jgi:hypothetical protein
MSRTRFASTAAENTGKKKISTGAAEPMWANTALCGGAAAKLTKTHLGVRLQSMSAKKMKRTNKNKRKYL